LTKLKNLERGLVHKYALEDDAELVKTLKSELAKIRQRIAELEREIKELTETEDIDIDETMETLDLCRHFNDYYQRLDPDGQARFLKSCFNEIIAYRGEYRQEKPGKVKKVLVVDSKGQEYLEDEDFIDDKADSDDLEDHLAVGGTGKKVKLDTLGFLWSEPFKKLYELQIIRKSDRIMSKSKGIVITRNRKTHGSVFS
jgi:hypothetical protein